MRDFYHRLLGLCIVDDQLERVTVAAGATTLTFVNAGPNDGKPFYHFAFSIPENKVDARRNGSESARRCSPFPRDFRIRGTPTT
jgi:catechol-2,3-dioxygenase